MRYLIILFLSFCLLQAKGQPSYDRAKLDRYFDLVEEYNQAMGSVAITKGDQLIYARGFGFELIEERKATPETHYRIGSISKTFTAVMILQMVDEGKLKLNTKLRKYFPGVENANKITVDHLLRHRSGILNFTNSPAYQTYMEEPKSRPELLELIESQQSVFEPGSKVQYSNSNYVLLSLIAEKIDGKTFDQILQDRICNPLELDNTYYGGKIGSKPLEAQSYTFLGIWSPSTETDMSIPMGAGAIVSTPTDLNLFVNALFDGKLISESSLNEMCQIQDGFGLGIFPIPFYLKQGYGHTGGIDDFRSMMVHFKDDGLSVSFCLNGTQLLVNEMMIAILSIYYGNDFELPDFGPDYEVDEAYLQQFEGMYKSPTYPLDINITTRGKTLLGQATGQSAFPLTPYALNRFKLEQAGIDIEFFPAENKMVFTQNGKTYEMKR